MRGRQTGRTTRMIQRALRLCWEDKRAPYIIAANERQRVLIRHMVEDLAAGKPHGVKVETWNSLLGFSCETMTAPLMHKNCVVLVDHFAIENRFALLLEELHRYDEGQEYETRIKGIVDDRNFDFFDRHRGLIDTQNTSAFTRCWAESAGKFWEVVRAMEALDGLFVVLAPHQVIPFRNKVSKWTTLVTERYAAVHAT